MAMTGRGALNKRIGRDGEKKACAYLKKRGYAIIARNYRNPFGEVDIIASIGDITAFIEVKTRLTDTYGAPSEAVGEARKRRYIQAANYYLSRVGAERTIRFDVIEVYRGEINHIENAFY